MEVNRKKSVQEKVTELQIQIKKLKMDSRQGSSKKAASLKRLKNQDQNHSRDVFSKGGTKLSSGDEMIIKLSELDLSNEETWLYIPEKFSRDFLNIEVNKEANQEMENKKISCI